MPVRRPPPTAQISLRESEGERRLGDLEEDGIGQAELVDEGAGDWAGEIGGLCLD